MESSSSLFLELAVVLGVASAIGYLIWFARLPLLVAYLIAGVIFSFLRIFDPWQSLALSAFPEIGIAFVLFFVGMEMKLGELKRLGWPIIISGLGQIAVSSFLGFLITSGLGFSLVESLLLGVGLSFSSTIVVVKLLIEKRELASLYGKLGIGILLLEDLVAIVLLMVMSLSSSVFDLGFSAAFPILALLAKGGLLLILSLGLSRYVLRRLFMAIARSPELLFLSAISWCFVFVAISLLLGFSVVIGAFLAGLALANSPFYWEIQSKVRPLRDFFVALFFVYLGTQAAFGDVLLVAPLIVGFVLYALFVKPVIFLVLLGALGFRKHTMFQTALNLSQISEFSLIILAVAASLGVVSAPVLTGMALAIVFSVMVSSVLIAFSRKIYKRVSGLVGLFEHGKFVHEVEIKKDGEVLEGHVVLVGAHRMGGEIIRFLKRERIPVVVLDFNPRVIQNLVNEDLPAMYGDVGDPEILEFLNIEKAKVVVSTAPDMEDNLVLLTEAKRRGVSAPVLVRASSVSDAKTLYAHGADYVILPEIVSGEFVMQTLRNHWDDLKFFKDRAETELARLFRNKFAFE